MTRTFVTPNKQSNAGTVPMPSLRPFLDLTDETNLFKSPLIPVPNRAKSLIIGKGGSTIRQLEQDHQVRIEFSNGKAPNWGTLPSDGNMQIVCNESNDKWKRCEKAIQQYLKTKDWHWTGTQYEERNAREAKYGSKRNQIEKLALERNQFFEMSKKAFENGAKKEAKELAEKGHAKNRELHALKKSIQTGIVEENVNLKSGVVDLHGLEVEQAKQVLNRSLEAWARKPGTKRKAGLEVITGRGVHSEGKAARVKPAILLYLQARGIKYESVNDGSVVVYV